MLKRSLHIIIALLLVFTTTASIWGHLIANDDDPIEISIETESDGEKNEKEKELDKWDTSVGTLAAQIIPEFYCGLQKAGSSSFAPSGEAPKKLYLLYRHLKLDC